MTMDPVKHWLTQIDRMLNKRTMQWAHQTLEEIKETIEENEKVTKGQIEAIKNIKWGKNRMGN